MGRALQSKIQGTTKRNGKKNTDSYKDIYGCDYIPDDTGEKRGEVSSDCILQIEKIENYEDIMSQFADFENFYE